MAFSQPLPSPITKEQTVLVCQLCENDHKLKWKCLECRLMMCQRCRDTVHPKFYQNHTIIDLKNIHKHSEEEQKPDFTKLKCSEHNGQNSCLYCKRCCELVCPLCITKTHNKHDLIEISEGYNIQMDRIKKRQEDIQERIKNLSKGEDELRKREFLEGSSYKKSKQGILKYKKSLIRAIKELCEKLQSTLDKKWSDLSKFLKDEQQRVKVNKETLLKESDEVNSLHQSNDAMKVFSSQSLLKAMDLNYQQIKNDFDPVPKFVPGDITKVSILQGKLQKVSPYFIKDLAVVQKFQTTCKQITNLVVCPNDLFWINDIGLRLIQKVSSNWGNLDIQCKFSLTVEDMTLTRSGDLLLSVARSHLLKVITSGTQKVKDSVYNVSPLEPMGVHATKDNKIIIGAVDTGPTWTPTGPRQVIILTQSGRQEKVIQFDNNRKPLFTFPARLTSNTTNIGVVDWFSEDCKGRVVIMDQDGGIKHIYTGNSMINSDDTPLKPTAIVTTPLDNFIIADYTNNALHILSTDGEIINYYNTIELRIKLPVSLSLSHYGTLYIGCGTYENSEEKTIIYKINDFVW